MEEADLAGRVADLERKVERLEGALEAHAALLAMRAGIGTSAVAPPLSIPEGMEVWELYAFGHVMAGLQAHKPAAAATPRAEGYDLVEAQILAAIHWIAPT